MLIPWVMGADEDWTTLRVDPRMNISFPSEWNWVTIPVAKTGMDGYFMQDKKLPGLYVLLMVIDSPIYQVPDEDLLTELLNSLMDEYPDYHLISDPLVGSDEKRYSFLLTEWDNVQTGEKLTLIVAGSKKTIVYLWIVYPSELYEDLYRPTMNDIITSLNIF